MSRQNVPSPLSRRRVLLGLGGAIVALPALDIFTKSAGAQSAVRPVYSATIVQQNGAVQGEGEPDMFWPRAKGAITAAAMRGQDQDRTTSELADYADRLNFVRGIDYHYSSNHDGGAVAAGTGAPVKAGDRGPVPVSESVDVFIANKLTPGVEPLNLYVGKKGTLRDDCLSFGTGGALRVGDNNPWNVYKRLMELDGVDPMQVDLVRRRQKSVNDLVRTELKALLARTDLSEDDRRRLDLHFSNIRDLENQVTEVGGGTLVGDAFEAVNGKHTENDNFEVVARLQLELIAFAFASDRARTATVQLGGINHNTRFMIDGVLAPPFHFISHRIMSDGGDGASIPNAVGLHHQIDRIHARFFKHLLEKLSAYNLPGGGTLLDQSVNVWVNSIANGPPHGGKNIPYVLAGGAGGFLKTGNYVEAAGYSAKVLNTIASACGVRKANGDLVDNFGDPEPQGLLSAIVA